jgi:hypothetical protein
MVFLFADLCDVLAIGLFGAEAEVYQARAQSNSRHREFGVNDGRFLGCRVERGPSQCRWRDI